MSAEAILSLLEEDDPTVQEAALIELDGLIETNWASVEDHHFDIIKKLAGSNSFAAQEVAALVASKCYFHQHNYIESMNYALLANEKFEVDKPNDAYIDKIITVCVDSYCENRRANLEQDKNITIDKHLVSIVDRMFERCFNEKEFKQALGIAIESRRLDMVEKCIKKSENPSETWDYCLRVANELIMSREFRTKVLNTLVKLYDPKSKDYFGKLECLLFLDDDEGVSDLLKTLIDGIEDEVLSAYQIAFDLQDRAPQHLLQKVRKSLFNKETTVNEDGEEDLANFQHRNKGEDFNKKISNLKQILDGTKTTNYHVDFLCRRNKTDRAILNSIKDSFNRNPLFHSATLMANAYMYSGTSIDSFLKDNMNWVQEACNWQKFNAAATLGAIHKGQFKESRKILTRFLPPNSNDFLVGGSLYGLGFIHSNQGESILPYLLDEAAKLTPSQAVSRHGAYLGIGLAAMASSNETIFENLQEEVCNDNAVFSEAAGVACGLVMLGSGDKEKAEELIDTLRETKHEKIMRGLSLGISLIFYGREEEADEIIDDLLSDKNDIIRYGAIHTIGLAYAGTANNKAIRNLLKIGVSDVSNDVRRAAITNLGLLMFKKPAQCPRLLELLAKSFNAHVRYGVAMALGIACAGTGNLDAIAILETLVEDSTPFVVKGAYLALAMILMQFNEKAVDSDGNDIGEKVKWFRETLTKTIKKVRVHQMTKFGAILAQGILDAGGRNVNICLHKGGHNKMKNIVGVILFTQYWFWFPYLHFMNLSYEPTCVIALNSNLEMPKFSFKSNVPPSRFAYPEKRKKKVEGSKKLGPSVALSVSKKVLKEKKKKGPYEPRTPKTPATVTPGTMTPSGFFNDTAMEIIPEPESVKKENEKDKQAEEDKKEPEYEILQNPQRVTLAQLKHISFDVDVDKYTALKSKPEVGFLVLKYLGKGEQEIVEMKQSADPNENEAPLPKPFEYDIRKLFEKDNQ